MIEPLASAYQLLAVAMGYCLRSVDLKRVGRVFWLVVALVMVIFVLLVLGTTLIDLYSVDGVLLFGS